MIREGESEAAIPKTPLDLTYGREVDSSASKDEFSPEYMDELKQDVILDRKTRTSRRGDVDYLRVGIRGTHPSKSKWIEKDKVREQFPHLSID